MEIVHGVAIYGTMTSLFMPSQVYTICLKATTPGQQGISAPFNTMLLHYHMVIAMKQQCIGGC